MELFPAGDSCNLEGIQAGANYVPLNDAPIQLKRIPTIIYGWLSPRTVSKLEARARLRFSEVDGPYSWETDITRWVEREDVVASLGENAWDKPGFAQSVDFKSLPPGTYRMTVIFKGSTRSYVCDKGRELILK